MLVTDATLSALYTTFLTTFQAGYQSAETWADRVSFMAPSSTRRNTYAWMGVIPRMREWLGDRVVNNLDQHAATVNNKDWENTLSIRRNDIEDDQFGVFSQAVAMLGQSARKVPDLVIKDLMVNGNGSTMGLAYDGQYFFDTDHPVSMFDSSVTDGGGNTTQSNYKTGTALTRSNFAAMRAVMRSFVGEDGLPLGVNPNLLVVPPALEDIAEQIVKSDFVINTAGATPGAGAATQSNTLKGKADVLVIPELAGNDTTWYLLDTTRPVKPFVWQTRTSAQFVSYVSPSDPLVFRKKEYTYGADMRGNGGYALWWLALRAVA